MKVSFHSLLRIFVTAGIFLGGLPSSKAESVKPRVAYRFAAAEELEIKDQGGNGFEPVLEIESDSPWVATEYGNALQLEGEKDRLSLPPESFPGLKGAVRMVFDPQEPTSKAQYLFRVYDPHGDGLTVMIRDGEVIFRYYHRGSGKSTSATVVPAKASREAPVTLLANWDLESAEPWISLQSTESAPVRSRVSIDTPAEFAAQSKVVIGNEHQGNALFTGLVFEFEMFDQCLPALAQEPVVSAAMAKIEKVKHQRVVPQTLLFTRTQAKYDLFSNTLLRRWIDRPLFFDRRTGRSDQPYSIVTQASFMKTQESARRYGLNAIGQLVGKQPFATDAFLEMLGAVEAHPEAALPMVLELSWIDSEAVLKRSLELFVPLLERVLQSPKAMRINGKVLILSYAMDAGSLPLTKAFIEALRHRFGDTFLFVVDVTSRRPVLLREFEAHHGITVATLEDFRRHLRQWLEFSDGLMSAGGAHTNHPDGTFNQAFYRDVLIPTLSGVLSEEPHKGKLLGLDAEVGYVNVMTSRRINPEEGTRRLREGFELAVAANPDFIAMPEWDELNENTSIGPTLTNSLSTQRLVRHFSRQIKGEPLQPMEGDDLSVPNLVLSLLPYVRLGEKARFEVLSIPDGSAQGVYRVELTLYGSDGSVVKRFPEVALRADRLEDHQFELASERYAQHAWLQPALKITGPDGKVSHWRDGLESVRLRPTWNLNAKWTKLPLRDLLVPQEVSFKLEPDETQEGSVRVTGKLVTGESILSAEVVQDEASLYAVDPKETYRLGSGEALVQLQWQSMRNPLPFTGTIEVKGGRVRQFTDWTRPEYKRASYRLAADEEGIVRFATDEGVNSTNARGGFWLIGDAQDAVIEMKTNRFTTTLPVREILSGGRVAKVFSHGLTLEARRLDLLPEVPFPVLEKEVAFEETLSSGWSRSREKSIAVRYTSQKGRRERGK